MNGTMADSKVVRLGTAIVALAMVSTIVMPGRQTANVITAMCGGNLRRKCGRMMSYPYDGGWTIVECTDYQHDGQPWHHDDVWAEFHENDARWFNEQYAIVHGIDADDFPDCRFRWQSYESTLKAEPRGKGAAR